MRKETKVQTKVGVGIETLWKALGFDLKTILPKVVPNLVTDIQLLDGEGGLGTLMLLNFGPDVRNVKYQKEQVVEFDEAEHRMGLEVIEGGHLELGFTFYRTSFQLTGIGSIETQVDITVVYDTVKEELDMPLETTKSALLFIKCLEKYLLAM